MNILTIIIIVVVLLLIAGLFAYLVRIVPQATSYVVERLGAYHSTWNTGIHVLIPFVDRIANKVTLKEIVKDFAPQPVITKDNVTMQIDTVVYFQITDPKLYTYGVVGPITAIENLTATTLRNIIGELELDETLTSRDIINTKMRAILTAEGEKEAMILRANAKKESMIAEAEGKAKAMERIYEAQARGIEMIKDANPTKEYLSLKSLETYEKMADGKATKIVVPSELQNMASLLTSAKEILVDDAKIDLLKGSIEK